MTEHIDQIMRIMGAAFDPQWGEAWNRRQIEDALQFPHTHYQLIAPSGSADCTSAIAAGFTLSRRAADEEELLLIAVDPAFRGRGLGANLLARFAANAAANGVAHLFLEMRANNPAESFYNAAGFESIGRRRNYYRAKDGNSIDAITYAVSVNKLRFISRSDSQATTNS